METMLIRSITPTTHRFLVRDAHHAESICGMARPVVLGTEIDETLLISLGVISAERVNARLRRHLIEPNAREEPARRLDTLGSRSAALVRHDLRLKAGSLQLAFVRHGMHFVASGCPCAS